MDFGLLEKGKDIYIPGSFWGLAGDGASKMWKCSVFQYDPHYKFSDLATNSVSQDPIFN